MQRSMAMAALAIAALGMGASRGREVSPSHEGKGDGIKVCQVGYLPDEAKFAMVTAPPSGDAVVRREGSGNVVLTVPVGPVSLDAATGDEVRRVDFTRLTQPGRYYLEVPGVGRSTAFAVGKNVFSRAFRLTMRAFTGQRCGTAVSLAPDFPQYHYDACHTEPATFHPSSGRSGQKSILGGWHDAGDYGRYVVNSGITTGTLLWAYELNAAKLRRLKLDLPESGNGTPDVLNEVRWNLKWMLEMQDADGGVWHKATSAGFCGFVMPKADTLPVLIIGNGVSPYKTTAATGDFAAVMAAAGRIYRPFDRAFADRCLASARRAWSWLHTHGDNDYTRQPEGISTGGYGDSDPSDERLWAAAELFRTTGERAYGEDFLARVGAFHLRGDAPQGWPNVGNLALYTYALSKRREADAGTVDRIKREAVAAADEIVARSQRDGYRVPMLEKDYNWGSNSGVANYGMMLILADRLSPKAEYRNAAQDCLHYLLGRNTFDTSFVTWVGARWPMHPHHRPSGADGVEQPWPGMLVGGPNANGKTPPARQWVDKESDYTVNEIAINWNAPLVFDLANAIP